jgi:hypothetical protein
MGANLYARIISNLNVLNERAERYNDTSTFMSANQRKFCCQWPVSVHCVKICVADSRELDVDENLIRARLLDWDPLVNDG